MEAEWLGELRESVEEAFPEMRGAEMRAQEVEGGGWLVSFHKELPLPDGPCLRRVVRAHVNPRGEVTRITSSK
jgi:hypothetical protein